MESKKIKEINLTVLAGAVLRRIWIVILAACVMAAGFYLYTKNFVTPMYKTYVSFCVNNGSTNQSVTASDLATSQRLVLTYVEGLRSNTVLEAVSKELGGTVSAGSIAGMMSADTGSETEIFRLYISLQSVWLCSWIVLNNGGTGNMLSLMTRQLSPTK